MKLTLLIALAAVSACAQKTNWANVRNLPIGGEIRVSLEDGKSLRGQLQNVTDESLVIIAASSQQTLARPQIAKVATKGDSHRKRNAFLGFALGAGAGVGTGAALDAKCHPNGCLISNSLGKEVLTPLGAVIGTIVGLAWPTGLWHEVYRSK
jgi:hypothetical protein